MKKIFTLLFTISGFVYSANAQLLLEDDFNYSGMLSDNGWTITGTNVVDPIMTTGGLTYAGYAGSGIGNAANVVGTNQDVSRGFANQTGAGTEIWMSALVNVTDSFSTTGGYFLHIGDRNDSIPSTFSVFAARLFVKSNGDGNVNFGISNTSAAEYGTTSFNTNTTYLVVIKYSFDTSATGANDVRLWVIQSGVPTDQASLGTPEVSSTTTNGLKNLDAVGIRQTAGIPDVIVDGIRIGNSFNEIISLPLNLVSFDAFLAEKTVKMKWVSTNEVNVKDFSIQRSNDGRTYAEIGNVGALNRSEAAYSFTDNSPLEGLNYYRLKMTDKDGAFKYSKVALVNNRNGIKASVFPNPVIEGVTVVHTKAIAEATIKIANAQGQQLKIIRVQQGATQSSFSASDLGKGTYFLIYQNGTERSVTKFVK